jgi:hypothetical protein
MKLAAQSRRAILTTDKLIKPTGGAWRFFAAAKNLPSSFAFANEQLR